MWKKEDLKSQRVPEISTIPVNSPGISKPGPVATPRENPSALPVSARAVACISQGIKIKGEVHGSEDLFIDGYVEGKLEIGNASLTVGPNGTVKADVTAREVIVRGRIEGKISGREKVQLWSTGHVTGEVQTERLAIEEGGTLRGKVEAGKAQVNPAEVRAASAGAGSKPADSLKLSSGTAAD
ncbi:MAG: polymer-forming cytoskeletal protein [Candidatus Acidiferrales bacterium]